MLNTHEYQNSLFKEALLIASPELYEEFRKTNHLSEKMQLTLYKYWSRVCTRSTPFGLFGTCSTGGIDDYTHHLVSTPDKIHRKTRLDMKYICELVQYLENDDSIRANLTFYPNDSIYKVGTCYRYIEYIYEQGKRTHYLQEVKYSKHINAILNNSRNGASINQLEDILVLNGLSKEIAHSFIIELIDNQVLVSDISPNITGDDALNTLIIKLQQNAGAANILNCLNHINKILYELDRTLVPNQEIYESLIETVVNIGVPFERKHLLQVDAYREAVSSTISNDIVEEIENAITFLIKTNQGNIKQKTKLDDFITQYRERFEDEEISLLEALDSEIGIPYPDQLIEDSQFLMHPMISSNLGGTLSDYERVILNKYLADLNKTGKCTEILIDERDFHSASSYHPSPKLTTTITVVAELKKEDDSRFIVLKGVGGATAASMIGRFAYMDKKIESIMYDICQVEKNNVKDCLIAEIVHLPESRVGNVTSRQHFRDCEITYLTSPGNKDAYHIPVSDIMVRVVNNEIILRSRRYNKRIIPKLSNAHNFSLDTTPIYRFLCDMQYHNSMSPYIEPMNNLINLCHYTPRVRYNKCYVSLRKWKICYNDIFETLNISQQQMLTQVKQFIIKKEIPDSVLLQEGDNSLYISFNNETSICVLYDILKRNKVVILEEYIAPDNSVCDSNDNQYHAEYVIPFKLN